MGINSKTIDELLKNYLNSLSQEKQIEFIKSVDEYSKLPILEQLKVDCERFNKRLGQTNDKGKNCPRKFYFKEQAKKEVKGEKV